MKCQRVGCTNDAHLRPILSFASKMKPHGARAEFMLPLPVCDEHATNDVSHYVNDESWAQIVAVVKKAGRAYPDRDSLQVRYVPIS